MHGYQKIYKLQLTNTQDDLVMQTDTAILDFYAFTHTGTQTHNHMQKDVRT